MLGPINWGQWNIQAESCDNPAEGSGSSITNDALETYSGSPWVGRRSAKYLLVWVVTSKLPIEFRDTRTSASQAEKSGLHSSRWVCHSNSFLISCVLPPLFVLIWSPAVHAGLCCFVFVAFMAWTIWVFWRFCFLLHPSVFYGRTHQCVESCEDRWRSLTLPPSLQLCRDK